MVWQVNDDGAQVHPEKSKTPTPLFDSSNFATAAILPSSPSSSSIDVGQPSPGSGLQTEVESTSTDDMRSGRGDSPPGLEHYAISNQNVIEIAKDAMEEIMEDGKSGPVSLGPIEPKEDFTQHIGVDLSRQ